MSDLKLGKALIYLLLLFLIMGVFAYVSISRFNQGKAKVEDYCRQQVEQYDDGLQEAAFDQCMSENWTSENFFIYAPPGGQGPNNQPTEPTTSTTTTETTTPAEPEEPQPMPVE